MKTDPARHLTGWDPFILQWKLIEEFPFVEILVSELLCGQPKNHIAIRAYDVLAVFAGSANVFQISATSYGLHDRKHQHHCFGANPLPSSIHRATIRTGINIADFLTISAIPLCVVTAEKSDYLNLPFIFLGIPFFHTFPPNPDLLDSNSANTIRDILSFSLMVS